MSTAQAATFSKWACVNPRWFVFADGIKDDAETGGILGDGQPYYRLTVWA